MRSNLDDSERYNRTMAVAMTNIKPMRDPFDPFGYPMLVDLDDTITIELKDEWCSICKAYVLKSEGKGRWTYWLGEPDKWYCEKHK